VLKWIETMRKTVPQPSHSRAPQCAPLCATAAVLILAAGCAPSRGTRVNHMIHGNTAPRNCAYKPVKKLPRTCSRGACVVVGKACQSRCWCTRRSNWRCIHQPCMRQPDPHPTEIRRPLPPGPPSRKSTGPAARRVAAAKTPHWTTRSRFDHNDQRHHTDYLYRGRSILSCYKHNPKRTFCTPSSTPLHLPARCWRKARGSSNRLHRITSHRAFTRIFGCPRFAATINWKKTTLVWVRQTVPGHQKLRFGLRKSATRSSLYATLWRQCYGAGRHTTPPAKQRHYLLVLPRPTTPLLLRLRHDKSPCGNQP
jgi:hypothetical protein